MSSQYLSAGKSPSSNELQKLNFPVIVDDIAKFSFGDRYHPEYDQESVIQGSERVKVNVKSYPYSAIGVISSYFGSGSGSGTGVLVASNIVFTCAHNLYDRKNKQKIKTLRFTPAQQGLKGEVFNMIDYYVDPLYMSLKNDSEANRLDYAIIVLDRSAAKYGTLGVQSISSQDTFWRTQELEISGYSGDKFVKTNAGYQKYQYTASDIATGVDHFMISYKISTFGGNSGSPVFYKAKDNRYYVVGTHNLGLGVYNQGVRINSDIYKLLLEYIESRVRNETFFMGKKFINKNTMSFTAENLSENPNEQAKTPSNENWDNRRKANVASYPHSAIGTVEVKFGENSAFGSGFIVGRNAILTTATNLYDAKRKNKAQSITFYPSLNGLQGIGYTVIKTTVLEKYEKSPQSYDSYNIAVLQVEEDLEDTYGAIGLAVISDEKLKTDYQVSIAGYPGDKIVRSEKGPEKYQYVADGRVKQFSKGLMTYAIDTAPGNAGSPIYYTDNSTQSAFAVGIHIGKSPSEKAKYGTKISENKFAQIKKIIEEYSEIFGKPGYSPLHCKFKKIEDLPIMKEAFFSSKAKELFTEAKRKEKNFENFNQENFFQENFFQEHFFQEKAIQEKVFGFDERTAVVNPLETPFKTIGRLKMKYSDGIYTGTGTLIAPNVVLTCGHNVYNRETRESVQSVTFSPAYTREREARGETYTVKSIYVNPLYKSRDPQISQRNDLALLALSSDLSKQYGYLGLESVDPQNSFWHSQPVTIVGYPGDLSKGQKQYIAAGMVGRVDETLIEHRIDTFGGNSGSAIYYKKSNGDYRIVGVHTAGYNDIKNGVDQGTNLGPRLTKDFVNQIQVFIDRSTGLIKQSFVQNTHEEEQQEKEQEFLQESTIDQTSLAPYPNSNQKDFRFIPSNLGVQSISRMKPFIDLNNTSIVSSTSAAVILARIKLYYLMQSNVTLKQQAIKVYVQIQNSPLPIHRRTRDFTFIPPLHRQWQQKIPFAIDRINEAVPGLRLEQIPAGASVDRKDFVIRIYPGKQDEAFCYYNILSVKNPYLQLGDPKFYATDFGTVTHEIVHALGISHEMKRKDTASGVNVFIDNIDQDWKDQYRASSSQFGVSPFDPYSLMMYPLQPDRWMKKNLNNVSWNDKKYTEANQFLSELDKVGLNILYPPCITKDYKPKKSSINGLNYCGRTIHQNSQLGFTDITEGTYTCGPETGPNCPSCRVLKNSDIETLLKKGGDNRDRWQGWSGRIYCYNKFGNKMCGPNTNDACEVCTRLLDTGK